MPSRLEQEHFTKMNRKSANTCLTDMINISIESFKLLLNEINQFIALKRTHNACHKALAKVMIMNASGKNTF